MVCSWILLGSGLVFATTGQALQNGNFDTDLTGWIPNPEPNPNLEQAYVLWDETRKAALLLPYGAEAGTAITYSTLSQTFDIPENAKQLSFDIAMQIVGPSCETDVFSVTLNKADKLYELTSSQVYTAADINEPEISARYIDGQGLVQYAMYETTVVIPIENYIESDDKDDGVGGEEDADEEVSMIPHGISHVIYRLSDGTTFKVDEYPGDIKDPTDPVRYIAAIQSLTGQTVLGYTIKAATSHYDEAGKQVADIPNQADEEINADQLDDSGGGGEQVDYVSIGLVFQLKTDNTDSCVSSVYFDNLQIDSLAVGEEEEGDDADDEKGDEPEDGGDKESDEPQDGGDDEGAEEDADEEVSMIPHGISHVIYRLSNGTTFKVDEYPGDIKDPTDPVRYIAAIQELTQQTVLGYTIKAARSHYDEAGNQVADISNQADEEINADQLDT